MYFERPLIFFSEYFFSIPIETIILTMHDKKENRRFEVTSVDFPPFLRSLICVHHNTISREYTHKKARFFSMNKNNVLIWSYKFSFQETKKFIIFLFVLRSSQAIRAFPGYQRMEWTRIQIIVGMIVRFCSEEVVGAILTAAAADVLANGCLVMSDLHVDGSWSEIPSWE